jgi:hypothetical protein
MCLMATSCIAIINEFGGKSTLMWRGVSILISAVRFLTKVFHDLTYVRLCLDSNAM